MRVKRGASQYADHGIGQRAVNQLNGRHVNRHFERRRPAGGRFAGGSQHPLAQLINQANLFRYRNKFGRRNAAAQRMKPTHQRFVAVDFTVHRVGYRLVVNPELTFVQRLHQVIFKGFILLLALKQSGTEYLNVAGTLFFRFIQRQVGTFV